MQILLRTIAILILTISSFQCLAVKTLEEQAALFYQDQNWSEAAKAYQTISEQQPENQQAWYRLANALIETKQGVEAMAALENLKDSTQLPASQIAYQQAQAYMLTGNRSNMWDKLDQAVKSGYSNSANMQDAAIWNDIRDDDTFRELLKATDKNAHPCVHNPRFAEFDFWLGEWSVYGNTEQTGILFGNNKIEKGQDGCLVMESWTGASGNTGTSMNYYDGTKDKWVQHWVSMGGVTINIEGGLRDGSMAMAGKIYYLTAPPPQIRDFRATWTPLENGIVRQLFEESVDSGKTWYPWFEGFYFSKPEMNGDKSM